MAVLRTQLSFLFSYVFLFSQRTLYKKTCTIVISNYTPLKILIINILEQEKKYYSDIFFK